MLLDPSSVINDVIMTSLLLLKIINVLVNFLISPDTLLVFIGSFRFEGEIEVTWIPPINSAIGRHYDLTLHHCVNQVIPRCWKW